MAQAQVSQKPRETGLSLASQLADPVLKRLSGCYQAIARSFPSVWLTFVR